MRTVLQARSLSVFNTYERTPTKFPLCQRQDDHIIKHVPKELGAGQTMQILHAHSSFLSSLPSCYYMNEFSVNHMRTTNAHNSLSAQPDQPHCYTFYKFWFLCRCEGICLNPCLLGIFNRNIWNANSNGSGQTCDVKSQQDLCRSLNTPEESSGLTKK